MPDRHARLVDVWLENADGERVANVEMGEPIRLACRIEARRDLAEPVFGFHFNNADARQDLRLHQPYDPMSSRACAAPASGFASRHGREPADPGRYSVYCCGHPDRRGEHGASGAAAAGLRGLRDGRGAGNRLAPGRREVERLEPTRPMTSRRRIPLELRDVQGPPRSAAVGGAFFELLYLISVTEFKKTYFGTVLGYVWSLLRPLMLFAVLLAVFTQVFRIGSQVAHYPVLLLFNIVAVQLLPGSHAGAVPLVVAQEGIVRKTQFPRLVIPLAIVLTAAVQPRPQPRRRVRLHRSPLG